MLHRDHWGRGYATEAARAIVTFGFDEMGTRQVSAWCFEANRASARVLEKAGLRLALRTEDVDPVRGQPRIALKYTIGRAAWRGVALNRCPSPTLQAHARTKAALLKLRLTTIGQKSRPSSPSVAHITSVYRS